MMKPKKALAKLARKRNDKKSDKSMQEHIEMAQQVVSEKVGMAMEKEVKSIEKKLEDWKRKKVEIEAIQRFVGRIMRKVKDLNIIVSCDHGVYLKEMGLISLLELDLVGTLNESGPITPEEARVKANRLLSLVIDSDCRDRIQQTWDGMAWIERSRVLTSQGENLILKYGT